MNCPLISCPGVLEPERHSLVAESSIWRDEGCLDLILFFQGDLVIPRIAIKEIEQCVASGAVNYLIDARKPEGILLAVLVEISIIDTHPSFIIVFLAYKYRIGEPIVVEHFFDETNS